MLPYLTQQKTISALITLPFTPLSASESSFAHHVYTTRRIPCCPVGWDSAEVGTAIARGTSPSEMIPNIQLRDE